MHENRVWVPRLMIGFALLSLIAAGCATGSGYVSPSGQTFLTQAAANYAAATSVARQTAEVVQQTRDARAQWAFEVTQTAVGIEATREANVHTTARAEQANARATATAEDALHRTATAEAQVAATAQAARQATATTEARVTQTAQANRHATATAGAQATGTAIAGDNATATASVVQTRTAAQLVEEEAERAVRMKRLRWQEMTAPLIYVGELLFWAILILIGLWTLVWAIPRLYHLLALKLSARGDVFFVPLIGGREDDEGRTSVLPSLVANWLDVPRLLSYNPRRDRGPGQVIDADAADPGSLPGHDPDTTARAQGVELAQVMAEGAKNGGGRVSRRTIERFGKPRHSPRYVVLAATDDPPQSFLPPQQIDVLDAEWEEIET